MIWRHRQVSRYIYEAVGFEELWLRGFCEFCDFLFFIYVVRVCLFSLEWVGFIWVRWGCREREPPCECESDRWTGVEEDTRRIWRSGEWVPPFFSLLHRKEWERTWSKKRDSNSKVRDMAQYHSSFKLNFDMNSLIRPIWSFASGKESKDFILLL